MGDEAWKALWNGLDRWIKINCYLASVWVFMDLLPLLPRSVADRLVALALSRVGL